MLSGIAFSAVPEAQTPTAAAVSSVSGDLAQASRTPQEKIERLATALRSNQLRDDQDLVKSCSGTNLKTLLFAMEDAKFIFPARNGGTISHLAEGAEQVENIINGGHPLAICLPLNNNGDFHFDYDGDHQLFQGSFAPSLRADLDFQKTGTASLGKGGGTIERFADVEYHLVMPQLKNGGDEGCARYEAGLFRFFIPVPPDHAADFKRGARLVILGRLDAPYFHETQGVRRVAGPMPQEIYQLDLFAHLAPSRIAVLLPEGHTLFECQITRGNE